MPTASVDELKDFLHTLPSGEICPAAQEKIKPMLSKAWEAFEGGSEERMCGAKICNNLVVDMIWNPPCISFVIDRHGRKCGGGSGRIDKQFWAVNLDTCEATWRKDGHRQDSKMARAVKMRPVADEIAKLVTRQRDDSRLVWLKKGYLVRIVLKEIPEIQGEFAATAEGRRKRFKKAMVDAMAPLGWEQVKGNNNQFVFGKSAPSSE